MYPRYVHLLYCFTYLICTYTYHVLIQLYCNQIWSCLRLTLYRRSNLSLCTYLMSLDSALSKNSSHLIPLQSTYISTVPRHSSYLRAILSIPCLYQFMSYVISCRLTTMSTSRSSLTSLAVWMWIRLKFTRHDEKWWSRRNRWTIWHVSVSHYCYIQSQ